MRLVSRFPVHIDYILGALLIISGLYQTYAWIEFSIDYGFHYAYGMESVYPYQWMMICGFVLILLPKKNLRRSIWLCASMLGVDIILQGYSEYESFKTLFEYSGVDPTNPLFAYCLKTLTISLVHFGCGIAALVNSVAFASKRINSIYPIILATVLTLLADYAILMMDKQYYSIVELAKVIITIYVPHMILLIAFMLLFTCDEVSWYTSRGDMKRALNKLKTTNCINMMYSLSRDQVTILMQCTSDCSLKLRHGKYIGILEIRCHDGKKDLVFSRFDDMSLAGSRYELDVKCVLPDTLSKSRYLDIYTSKCEHIRMEIIEPRKRLNKPKIIKGQRNMDVLPRFYYSVSNASLYHIIDGDGEVDLRRLHGKDKREFHLSVSHSGTERTVTVTRHDGTVFYSMSVRAIVPVNEYGAYTKLYIYGDMGKYLAFNISLPKRSQAEKPDTV